MTRAEILAKLVDSPIKVRECSICGSGLYLRYHYHYAAVLFDPNCSCVPDRELGPKDVASWETIDSMLVRPNQTPHDPHENEKQGDQP